MEIRIKEKMNAKEVELEQDSVWINVMIDGKTIMGIKRDGTAIQSYRSTAETLGFQHIDFD